MLHAVSNLKGPKNYGPNMFQTSQTVITSTMSVFMYKFEGVPTRIFFEPARIFFEWDRIFFEAEIRARSNFFQATTLLEFIHDRTQCQIYFLSFSSFKSSHQIMYFYKRAS